MILTCEECGSQFESKTRKRRFCSKACSNAATARLHKITRRGSGNPAWKGGRKIYKGYVRVYVPNHPAADQKGCVLEHRLVMEKKLGRYLTKEETVHHVYGKEAGNGISNLELWTSNHPPGQRVKDLVAWAKQILKLYSLSQPKKPKSKRSGVLD